jgi:hypothetical protein
MSTRSERWLESFVTHLRTPNGGFWHELPPFVPAIWHVSPKSERGESPANKLVVCSLFVSKMRRKSTGPFGQPTTIDRPLFCVYKDDHIREALI